MRKICLFLLILFLSVFISSHFSSSLVFADGKTFILTCLQSQNIGTDPNLHDFSLTSQSVSKNTDIYIIGCRDGSNGTNCAPATSSTGEDVHAKLNELGFKISSPDIMLSGKSPLPLQSSDGAIDTTVHINIRGGHIQDNIFVRFFALTVGELVVIPTAAVGDSANSLQIGSFNPQTQISLAEDDGHCQATHVDPYGRVFDAKTLEPIPDTMVELLDENKQHYNQIGIENPQQSQSNGMFNFYVKDGTYYLSASKQGYQFPTSLDQVSSNYSKAYSDLYSEQLPIIQKGQVTHRDIPLLTSGDGFRDPITLNSYGSMILPGTSNLLIEGQVSHPLSTIIVFQSGRELINTTTDAKGYFTLSVPTALIADDTPLRLQLGKMDLVSDQIGAPVFSQVTIEPIFRYVEGYAISSTGIVIPNAKVQVLLSMSNGIYYETTADAQGFFRIEGKYLPLFPYILEFISPKDVTQTSQKPSDFARSNTEYLSRNNIHLTSAKKDGIAIEKVNPDNRDKISPVVTSTVSTKPEVTQKSELITNILFLLFLVTCTAGALILHLKKKKLEQ